jgi:hypothetical protein
LIDLQIAAASKLNLDVSGNLIIAGGLTIGSFASGLLNDATGVMRISSLTELRIDTASIQTLSGAVLGWSSSATQSYVAADLVLRRDAADVFAQRRSTNAQTFRVYRSYTDGSNYSRLTNTWNTTTAVIHAEGAGTGSDGNIAFNDAALATSATVGYIMIPSCAGAPTGVPADIPTGQVALHFDSTNNKLYVYDGGWISTAALT